MAETGQLYFPAHSAVPVPVPGRRRPGGRGGAGGRGSAGELWMGFAWPTGLG